MNAKVDNTEVVDFPVGYFEGVSGGHFFFSCILIFLFFFVDIAIHQYLYEF
jgi:hypothetical protein